MRGVAKRPMKDATSASSKRAVNLPPEISDGYARLVSGLKERIAAARVRAALSVNRELILLYWDIGRDILSRQQIEGWGTKIIDRLAADLRRAFPEMTGLSARNLSYMRAFAEAWPDLEFVQQVVALLPWGHNLRLLDTVKSPAERDWYARQAIENGWSRNVLGHQIASNLFARQGSALTNFTRTLPAEQSELAQQILKDPYSFDFLSFGPELLERDLERSLIDHLRALILELGKGFAFVGSQYHLDVGGQDYYLDLLFHHLRLRCFVVIDLKIEDVKPEFAGKMNFYLSAVDDQLRHPDDQPSIGIILCKGRNRLIVEYALRDTAKPMGVAQYRFSAALPARLQDQLPTAADFAREFSLMSVLELRIAIEKALRQSIGSTDITAGEPIEIGTALRQLEGQGFTTITQRLLDALRIMNKTLHGLDVDPLTLQQAVAVGNEFLAELDQRHHDLFSQ